MAVLLAVPGAAVGFGHRTGFPAAPAALSITPENTWVTNGPVYAIASAAGTVYIGGSFTRVGPRTGPGVGVSAASAQTRGLPQVSGGFVTAAVPDGSGGFFIAGGFNRVGGIARPGLAHILSSGTVDRQFNPRLGGMVELALWRGTLYAAPYAVYAGFGEGAHSAIVALDARTGRMQKWSVRVGGSVDVLVARRGTLYVGGRFGSIGGRRRSNIAALDASSGRVTRWNPDASAGVRALAVSRGIVYAGGAFGRVGGQNRSKLAALSAATGKATAWHPFSDTVNALAVAGSTVYEGTFVPDSEGYTGPGGYVAAVSASTGARKWTSDAGPAGVYTDSEVTSLTVSHGRVYAGGDFTELGGQARNGVAALNAAEGDTAAWNPDPNVADVGTLAASKNTVYIGGTFSSIGGETRNNIAAIDKATGRATSLNPDADGHVDALAVSGETVYAGGTFSSIGGQPRSAIAAIDASTGQATSWNPDATGGSNPFANPPAVDALALAGGVVYAAGQFSSIGGQSRNDIAAVDATTGQATSFNPDACCLTDEVLPYLDALVVSGDTVYAGGSFDQIGGQPRNNLASLDATTGEATSWNPDLDGTVLSLATSDRTVYAAGYFHTVGGQRRFGLAAIDSSTGEPTNWDPKPDMASVNALAVSGQTVYIGGWFAHVGTRFRNGLAALNRTTGTVRRWNPQVLNTLSGWPNPVSTLTVGSDGTLYVGGPFDGFDRGAQEGFAAFPPGG